MKLLYVLSLVLVMVCCGCRSTVGGHDRDRKNIADGFSDDIESIIDGMMKNTSPDGWRDDTDSIRNFFGLNSLQRRISGMELKTQYVYALVKIENGKVISIDPSTYNSESGPASGTFEVLWGERDGKFGYSFFAGGTHHPFKEDPFFKHFGKFSGGSGTTSLDVLNMDIGHTKYRGLSVLATTVGTGDKFTQEDNAVRTALSMALYGIPTKTTFEDAIKDVKYGLAILFTQCETREEGHELVKKLKQPLE